MGDAPVEQIWNFRLMYNKINSQRVPINDCAVREAVALRFNYEQVVKIIHSDMNRAQGLLPPTWAEHNEYLCGGHTASSY